MSFIIWSPNITLSGKPLHPTPSSEMFYIIEKSAHTAPEGDKVQNYLTERQFACGGLPGEKAPCILRE